MAKSQASVNSIVNYRSQSRLILLCILLGASLMASVAVILSQNKANSTSTESLEKKQQIIDHLRTLAAEKGDLNYTLSDSLQSAEEDSQTLYDSLEVQKAANKILVETNGALIAQLKANDTEWLAKLQAQETKNQELTDLFNNLKKELTASRTLIVDLQKQRALEQSTNTSLLMELAALEAKQKIERDNAQVAVDAWHRALSRSEELKDEYQAAIKDSEKYPKLSDSEWGIPKDPDPKNPFVEKSQQMRKAYYLAWCDWNAFHAIDLDGTPEDYREFHLKYTSSLKGFLENLRKVKGHFIFNPPDNVLLQQRDNKSTYLAVVEKYRLLSAEEIANKLAADLEQKTADLKQKKEEYKERLKAEDDKFTAQTILLRKQIATNINQKTRLDDLITKTNKLATDLKNRIRGLKVAEMKLADLVTRNGNLVEQLAGKRKAEEAARAAQLLADEKKSAPIVVAAWKKAILNAKAMKLPARIAAVLANPAKNPECANIQWGLPAKAAVGLNATDRAFIQKQVEGRNRYLEAFSRYQAFYAVDLVGTSVEYRKAHDDYTESLRNLATGGLRRVTHKGKTIYTYDPQRQMAKHASVENKYKSVLDKYRGWEGLIP